MARKSKRQNQPQDLTALDQEAVEFIKLNAPYLSLNAMKTALQVSQEKMMELLEVSGADVSKESQEPRANDIARGLNFLPVGTKIEQWLHGTMIHLQSNIPGINRITLHYGLGDE